MTTGKSGETGGRYGDVCGATASSGEPCQLPAGWGTPGSGGGRCRYHGGCSTGPDDTDHLQDNDHAAGNPGGGAPELNTNAEVHGGFGDWQKVYDRLDDEPRAYVDSIAADYRETAAEHAPGVDADRRATLCREMGTLSIMQQRASADVWADADGDGPGRGLLVERTVDRDGVTFTTEELNPAFRADRALCRRQREIAAELSLWPGFQTD
jgi:hypothetical protein